MFVEDQKESSPKIAKPTLIKAMNSFLRIRKNIGTMVTLEQSKLH